MRWATRSGVHVDRAACAWLLRRFVDAGAVFVFVEDLADVPPDASAFDIRGAELSHHGGDRSFETILHRHCIEDPVLWAWIATPERDALTDSAVHQAVDYRPITRYEIVGGYTAAALHEEVIP